MTKGCRFGPFKSTDSRAPAGRFSRLVYAERYLNAAIFLRKLPNFGMGRPTGGTEERKNDRKNQNQGEGKQKHGETKPPHTPGRTNTKRKPTPSGMTNTNMERDATTRANETTANAEPPKQ